jgi:hypothetical protein
VSALLRLPCLQLALLYCCLPFPASPPVSPAGFPNPPLMHKTPPCASFAGHCG